MNNFKARFTSRYKPLTRYFILLSTFICMLVPGSGFAAGAASAKMRVKNESGTKLIVNMRQAGKQTVVKKISSGERITFDFSFGSCNRTKSREIEVTKPLPGGGYSILVSAEITIVASREGNSCKASMSFDSCVDSKSDAFKVACDNETGRIGKITVTDK
ncbi:MAG: hypothetical protein L3J24_07860 [Xanthomonadales bacterium]|nr:hypothetical protein [Xanthomonadales bacterium]